MERIKVIDSPLGSGKTSWAITYINKLPADQKVIFITPFLSECERIIRECSTKGFKQPNNRNEMGTKLFHLIKMIQHGENIVSTHSLFSHINDELMSALKGNNYILVLDEVMNVVEDIDIYEKNSKLSDESKEINTRADIKSLINKGYIKVDVDGAIHWIDEENVLFKYDQIKNLADRNLLYFINDSLLVWTFPIEIFRPGIFDEIYILTYLFKYQIQAFYYDYYQLPYSIFHIEKKNDQYQLIDTIDNDYELKWKQNIKPLIHICDNYKLNKIGSAYYNSNNQLIKSALSKTWYDNNKGLLPNMRQNLDNYFRHVSKSNSSQRLWSCFKENRKQLKCKGASIRQWLEITARATNDYGTRDVLAYLVNEYLNPFYISFFSKKNINIDQDGYALSELLQWIFRSAIRNNNSIQIYIPSERMRNLLMNWLDNDNNVEL
jgi:hypothetical protein